MIRHFPPCSKTVHMAYFSREPILSKEKKGTQFCLRDKNHYSIYRREVAQEFCYLLTPRAQFQGNVWNNFVSQEIM